mgnify:CR=1 FL=1
MKKALDDAVTWALAVALGSVLGVFIIACWVVARVLIKIFLEI